MDKPAERASILEAAIRESEGINLPLRLVQIEQREASRSSHGYEYLVEENALDPLRAACADRIRQTARTEPEALAAHPDLSQLLWVWQHWGGNPTEPADWLRPRLESPANLLGFLSRCLDRNTAGTTIHWRMRLSKIEQYVSIEEVEAAVRGIDVESLDEGNRLAVRCFQTAMADRQSGKDPDRHLNDDDNKEEWEDYQWRVTQSASGDTKNTTQI